MRLGVLSRAMGEYLLVLVSRESSGHKLVQGPALRGDRQREESLCQQNHRGWGCNPIGRVIHLECLILSTLKKIVGEDVCNFNP